jgi:hypothetical protein
LTFDTAGLSDLIATVPILNTFVYCTWHCPLAIVVTRLDFWVLMDTYHSVLVTLDGLCLNYYF